MARYLALLHDALEVLSPFRTSLGSNIILDVCHDGILRAGALRTEMLKLSTKLRVGKRVRAGRTNVHPTHFSKKENESAKDSLDAFCKAC